MEVTERALLSVIRRHKPMADETAEDILNMVKKYYNSPKRFYHNWNHIITVITNITKHQKVKGMTQPAIDNLIMAAIFHDVVYDVFSFEPGSNEKKSYEFYKYIFGENKDIERIIMVTAKHELEQPVPTDEVVMWEADNAVTYSTDFSEMLKWEKGIFNEFSVFPIDKYKEGRLKFLRSIYPRNPETIKHLIEYVESFQPRIGVYAGSFNPFHKGHFNIVQKAAKLFDKVIILQGVNPSKGQSVFELQSLYKNPSFHYEVDKFAGATHIYLENLSVHADVTLIRGLRDGKDLAYEMTQQHFMQNASPNMKTVYIVCDPEYQYISSGAIRALMQVPDMDEEVKKYTI